MKKGREKGGKEEKEKYLFEAYMTAKNPQKQGRILKGGEYFSGWP